MKYIKKTSTAPIPPINGAVVDNLNVENKTTNAPSIRLVEEMINPIGGFNFKTLYEDTTEKVGSKTANITNDSWLNYKMLAFKYKSVAGLSAWGYILMEGSIDTSEIFMLHLIDNKHGSTDVGSVRGIKIQFNSETQLQAVSRNTSSNTDCWLTKIVGIY